MAGAARAIRWLVLLPACLALLCPIFVATVAAHDLAEQHLCPAAPVGR